MSSGAKTCVVTGANGFVGGRLRTFLRARGWRVVGWTRHPDAASDEEAFRLGENIDPSRFAGVNALVHCAYDFKSRNHREGITVNVVGSKNLFRAAEAGGVASIVFISTASAFPGCRSVYGKTKLQIEADAKSFGAVIVRPGLVYADEPGGVFGRLVDLARNSYLLPVLWGGRQTQYLLHTDDLGKLVHLCLDTPECKITKPVTIAHEQGWELKEILVEIGRAMGKSLRFIPVPWQVAWLGLKFLECVGKPPGFRSDSLLSIVYQYPNPSFAALKTLGIQCRPFQVSAGMLSTMETKKRAAGGRH